MFSGVKAPGRAGKSFECGKWSCFRSRQGGYDSHTRTCMGQVDAGGVGTCFARTARRRSAQSVYVPGMLVVVAVVVETPLPYNPTPNPDLAPTHRNFVWKKNQAFFFLEKIGQPR